MDSPRILIIPGSARDGSLNRRLAAVAAATARAAGLQVTEMDLRALALPVYDGDLEAASGVPAGAHELRSAIAASDGVLFVTPEYNGFPTPLVINAFTGPPGFPPGHAHGGGRAATANKPAALLSAPPGPLGALRSMNFLRQYLQMAFAMLVAPQQFALGRANEAFEADGTLKDARAAQSVQKVVAALAALATALPTPR